MSCALDLYRIQLVTYGIYKPGNHIYPSPTPIMTDCPGHVKLKGLKGQFATDREHLKKWWKILTGGDGPNKNVRVYKVKPLGKVIPTVAQVWPSGYRGEGNPEYVKEWFIVGQTEVIEVLKNMKGDLIVEE